MRQENGEEEVNCFSSYLEVRYTITDTSKINKELMDALKARFRVLPISSRPVWWTDDTSWLDYVDADERAMEIIAKADTGRDQGDSPNGVSSPSPTAAHRRIEIHCNISIPPYIGQ